MEQEKKKSGLSAWKIFAIVLGSMLITMVLSLVLIKMWLFPGPFTPVVLSSGEEQRLEQKLARFEQVEPGRGHRASQRNMESEESLQPEPYSELGASREIRLTEREVNAMIAKNTDLANKMAVDFSDDLVSVKLLLPMDPDFPLLGGKTLRVRAGAELAFRNGRPVVIIRGVTVMGIPLPNAWMAGLKNIDLVQVFGGQPGFWKSFADGIASMQVREGSLEVVLME